MVKPKKYLGQHFLTDKNIANTIVDSLTLSQYSQVIEIGPGMGVLTEELVSRFAGKLTLIEIDEESAAYIKQHF
ncbi:MAG TPA: rRNA adenine N-6-methyltransferase family protein, partial [Bacteroidia bacterium]|nr:rRNA adenine N-6-methyltransferase family protein [Bacteroidia bacterium]